jgi:hypothetical protein
MPGRLRSGWIAAVLFLFLPWSARGSEPPDLSGAWKLNHELSEDAEPRVKEAAGSQYMQGGRSTWSGETVLPWGRKFSENERVQLREVLLGVVQELETLELEQTPAELKTIHGEAGVRIFYFGRQGSGASLVTDATVKRRAHWKGEQLFLESESGKMKVQETFALTPARDRLVHTLHVEMDLLKHDFDLRLVYDRR